jgi:hypothetical protein
VNAATLTKTANVLTVAVPRCGTEEQMQEALSAADAWIFDHAGDAAEPFATIDRGEQITWLFAAA